MKLGKPRHYIRGTAVRFSDIGTFALALPASHDAVRDQVRRTHGDRVGKHQGEDGFVTADGSFLNAREALVVARQAGQLRRGSVRGTHLKPDYLLRLDAGSNSGWNSELGASSAWQPSSAANGGSLLSSGGNELASSQQLRRELLKALGVGVVITLTLTGTIAYLARPVLLLGWDRLMNGITDVHLALLTAVCNIAAGIGFALVLNARGSRYRRSAVTAFLGALAFGCLWAASTRTPSAETGAWFFALWMLATVVALALFAAVRVRAAVLLSFQIPWLVVAAVSVA